jgi:hypothetical protein
MSSWNLLDEKEEADLHKSRLLNVEEKPFKRITKRLVALQSAAGDKARQAPTPPPESNGTNGETAPTEAQDVAELAAQLREDVTLDFAAFDSSVSRLRFLQAANARERERYADDRGRILETSQAVRENTTALRARLEQARATLAQRRRFDELADKITSNRMLRPRGDQTANLKRLEEECAQLEAESDTYADTWRERREQFSRIMDESMRLRRLIRDEKEEGERREGMDDEDGAGDADADTAHTPRPGLASGNATPRPDSGMATTAAKNGNESTDAAGTPLPTSTPGGRTPARDSPAPGGESQMSLKPRPEPLGSLSRSASRAPSVDALSTRPDEPEEGEDVEMADPRDSANESPLTPVGHDDMPSIVVDTREIVEEKMDTT